MGMSTMAKNKFMIALIGMILVIGIGMFIKFDRQAYVVSDQAKVEGDTYTIGIDYPGVITDIFVSQGDVIEAGTILATIKSTALIERINEDRIQPDDLAFSLNEDREIVLTANQAGRVQKISHAKGSFITANSELMLISEKELYVISEFAIPESDFYALEGSVRTEIRAGNRVFEGEIRDFDILDLEDAMVYVSARVQTSDPEALIDYQLGTPVIVSAEIKPNPMVTTFSSLQNFIDAQLSGTQL